MVIAGLTAFIANNSNSTHSYYKDVDRIDQAIIEAVAAVGVVVAIADCHQSGAKFKEASVDKTFYENLLTMMGRVDPSTGQPDPKKNILLPPLGAMRLWTTVTLIQLSRCG